MSYQAVQWALDDAPMLRTKSGKPDTTARAVLVARAERADEHGRDSHASIEDVIWRTGYDERTIQRAEDRLEQAGLLIRDGSTRWGTPRWHLDLARKRTQADRDEIEASISRRRAENAAREQARRDRLRQQRVDSPSARVDGNSTRADSASTRADSDAARVDAAPPEPPTNLPGTTPEPPDEPPPGGTLPPDPLRPQDPKTGDLGTGIESSLSPAVQEPPQPETATHDRAREPEPATPALRLIEGTAEQPSAPTGGLFPALIPTDPPQPERRGFGFCLPCHADGKTTLAADQVNGAACAHHLRSTG